MKTTVRAVFAGTISTGAFENEKPLFELGEEYDELLNDEELSLRQKRLYMICRDNFIKVERISLEEKIKLEKAGIRLYPVVDRNMEYPSVTSITGWDTDFNMPDTELAQYGARGTLVHKRCEHYDEPFSAPIHDWMEIKKLVAEYPALYEDYVLMTKGNRKLTCDGYDYEAFLKTYPIQHIESEQIVYNHEHQYAGRVDKIGMPDINDAWKKLGAKFITTAFDFKTSQVISEKYHWQISAYAKAKGLQQAIIIPLRHSKDVKRGFSTPVVVNVNESFEKFVEARKIFRKRFGI